MANAVIKAGLVAVSLVWALAAQTVLAAEGATYVKEGSKAAGLEACVEPTDVMRRNHMELIKHQRDATVHGGIRATKHSLAGCIDCHVSLGPDGRPVAVNAPDQFCSACHAFAAVKVNCFDCHGSVPNGGPVSEAGIAAHSAAGLAVAGGEAAVTGQ
ncbi:MAG: sulfur reduction protein DsrJ [Bdellovibrio bacteriovorus]